MNDLPALPTLADPTPATPRQRRIWIVITIAALVFIVGGGAWYYHARTQAEHEATAARAAEIAAARAHVVAEARKRGIAVSNKAVSDTEAAAKAAADAAPKSARVASASEAGALFRAHSWYVPPPPPPYVAPPPPPPPPPPMAPPLPFVFLGSYTPSGDATVYFLTRGDRVYDVKVGDSVDGIYQIESAKGGQLVFNYKPLNQLQTLAIGATP